MNINQLIPAMYLFLQNVSEFYGKIKADESQYSELQNCIDRLEIIEILDKKEHARLLILDRRLFQSLLPHLGYPEFFTLKSQLDNIIEAARMHVNPIYTQK